MNSTETKRLNAYIASSTSLSRRKSDEAIEQGRVLVNGKRAKLGDRVGVNDVVSLDGKTIEIYEKNNTYVLNKPVGYVCSSYDPHTTHYARNLVKVEEQERLFSIGRLDKDSEGLILFTTDGYLCEKITHPSKQIEKEYYVKTQRAISQNDIKRLKNGVVDKGEKLSIKKIDLMSPSEALIVLTEGKNREIRRLIESINNSVVQLVRLRIGGYSLPPSLKTGMFKKLSDSDINKIFALNGDVK